MGKMNETEILAVVEENYRCGRDASNIAILEPHRESLSSETLSLLARAYNNNEEEQKAIEIFQHLKDSGYELKAKDYYRWAYAEYYSDEEEAALLHIDLAMKMATAEEMQIFLELKEEMGRFMGGVQSDPQCAQSSPQDDENTVPSDNVGICFDIAWTFSQKVHTDEGEFFEEVKAYLMDIDALTKGWNKNLKVIDSPQIYIQYEAWIEGAGDLLPNESLLDGEELNEEYAEDGLFQVEILALLKADDGQSFAAVELLMKAHNQQANKELGDHVFFEGFDKIGEENEIPVYYISCGS